MEATEELVVEIDHIKYSAREGLRRVLMLDAIKELADMVVIDLRAHD